MSVAAQLRRFAAFTQLTDGQLASIERHAQRRRVAKGDRLITFNDRARRVFVVLSGKFVVLAKGQPVAEILPGESIGELAFFSGGRRTSDVVATRDSEVIQLDRRTYRKLNREIPELSELILAVVTRRMAELTRNAMPLPPRGAKTIALVPAGGLRLPADFIHALGDTLPQDGSVRIADATNAGDRDAHWLFDCEQLHKQVFLLCGEIETPNGREWFDFATRSCDCICLVVDSTHVNASSSAPHEESILANAATCPAHVVIWSSQCRERPRNSAQLLRHRHSLLRHHVCFGKPETMARFLRFLSGQALGVVLSGGGAYGTAHLGAVKALLEHGYDIDIYGGTSVGAAMAGALASQMPPDEIMARCEEIFVRSKAMSKLAAPLYSILDHNAFDEQMRKHYGQWRLEDLPLNYFAVSTSLTTNDMHIHRTGELWKTVRASGSIPAIFPPMIADDGEVLIDGALIDNLPVDVMRKTKAGPNIILSFQEQPEWRLAARYEDMPSRLAALWQWVTRSRNSNLPTLTNVLAKTMVVTARRRQSALELLDDVMIDMPTSQGMGTLDWKLGRQQFDLAYRSMGDILDRAGNHPGDNTVQRLEALRDAASSLTAR
ncbi:MAG: patatin-like phospholipase family protein [Ahrensia sp.]|nr:patatin-like phospholipase family protein [Ahrensia sp.]